MNIDFLNYSAFYLLLALILLFLNLFKKDKSQANYKKHFSDDMYNQIFVKKESSKISYLFLLMSYIFIIISIARPIIINEKANDLKDNGKFLVLFDISASMQAKDIYPSRIDFVKNKFNILLENLTRQELGILAFTHEVYLLSAITSDYESLKYKVKNLNLDNIDVNGSNLLKALKKVPQFLNTNDQKVILIFTDGTEKSDFSEEIKYAKSKNIRVYIYATATNKGINLTKKQKILKDANGNIVITSLNNNIQSLAKQTNGKYKEFSLIKNDIKTLLNPINEVLKKEYIEKNKDVNQKELFFIPLSIAILFYLLSLIKIKRIKL